MSPRAETHHRHSIRLPQYDYASSGAYFVTICTWRAECLLGEIVDGRMQESEAGRVVREEWFRLAVLRPGVVLETFDFVVMPNHVHGILWLVRGEEGEAWPRPYEEAAPGAISPLCRGEAMPRPLPARQGAPSGSLGAIVGQFKSASARRINQMRGTPGLPVWQRNYYERILRDEPSLLRIREYIANNPQRWQEDQLYPRSEKWP